MDLTIAQAADVLDIPSTDEKLEQLDESTVTSKYREKVKEKHPDQGGSNEEFQKVREARNTLVNFIGSDYQKEYSKLHTDNKSTNTNTNTIETTSSTSNQPSDSNTTTKKTSTSNQAQSNSSTSTANTNTTTTNARSNTSTDWYDKAQKSDKAPSSDNNEELQKEDSIIYNILVTMLTYFNLGVLQFNSKLKTSYILLLGSSLSLLKLGGDAVDSTSLLLELPGIEQITPEVVQLFLFVAPVLIVTDIYAQKLRAKYTLLQLLDRDVENLDEENPVSYNIITKLVLVVGTFTYTGVYLAMYVTYSYQLVLLAQLSLVLVYALFRKTPPTKAQIIENMREQ